MNITFEDFKKLDIRIGKIISAEHVDGSEKLLRLEVDFGEKDPTTGLPAGRQVLSGIAKFYTPEDLIGKLCPFITNLGPRKIMGMESQGVIMAADPGDGNAILLHPDKDIMEGSCVR